MTTRLDKKAATRARLVTAAKALWDEHAYEDVSLRDIARKAGYSTGAIFSLWEGKEALWVETMGRPPETAASLRSQRDALAAVLAAAWSAFTQADYIGDALTDAMERLGLAELRGVTDEDLEQSFAAELGIERNGMVWVLTPAGRAAYDAAQPLPPIAEARAA